MQAVQEMFIRVEEKEEFDPISETWKKVVLYSGHEVDMTDYAGWVMLDGNRHKVVFQIPDTFDLNKAKLEAVKKEMETLRASFQNRITELTAQYNSLLAIEA